jgi:hypothetical protein
MHATSLTTLRATLCRLLPALIVFALLLFAAPFVALMFFASPSMDDFARATLAPPNATGFTCPSSLNSISVAWAQYAHLAAGKVTSGGSGRWLTSLLQTSVMSTFGLSTPYGWLLLLVVLTNIVALAYFFKLFFRVPPTRAAVAASVLYAAWLASYLNPGDNIFYLTGALEYQFPISIMLILAALLCRSRHTWLDYVLLAASATAIPAQHEIAGFFLLVCLLAGAVIAVVLKQKLRPWLLASGFAFLSLAAIMLSPAMISKFAFGEGGGLPGTYFSHLYPHVTRAVQHGVDWVLNPVVLLAVLCTPLLLWPSEHMDNGYRPPGWLALLGLGAICVLLGEYAGVEMVSFFTVFPPRVVGFYQFLFLVLLTCVIVVGVPELSTLRPSVSARLGLFLLFAISLLVSQNFRQAQWDLRGPARSWHEGNVARLMQVGEVLQFDPLPQKPVLFLESGLSKNTACWVNQCMAAYLGANLVSLRGPKENHWDGGNPCDPDSPTKTTN